MTNLQTPPEEPRPLIDTSKMSAGQRAALELTEAARESARPQTFAGGLFMGEFDLAQVSPFPIQSVEDRDQGDAFLKPLEALLRDKVDPDAIDPTGEIPQPVIDELARLGAFGIKVPREYGGLGLVADELLSRGDVAGQLVRQSHRPDFSAPIHRRAAAAHPVRHRTAEAQIPAARRAWRNFGLCAYGNGGRFRPGGNGHARRTGRRTGNISSSMAKNSGARTARKPA